MSPNSSHPTAAGSVLGGGGVAAIALLTRPNLLPVAALLTMFLVWQAYRRSGGQTRQSVDLPLLFIFGVVPGCVAVAWVNQTLYGSPLLSGYGSVDDLYALANVGPNLALYFRWMVESQTPFVCLAVGAPILLARRRVARSRDSTWFAWLALAMAGTVLACYLPYMQFDGWWAIRFLLPALPLVLILSTTVLVAGARGLPDYTRAPTLILVTHSWSAHACTRPTRDPPFGKGTVRGVSATWGHMLWSLYRRVRCSWQ